MKLTLPILAALQGLASTSAIPQPASEPPLFIPTVLNVTILNEPSSIAFHACGGFQLTNNIFNIEHITIDPNPIKKRADVHIVANGQLKKKIAQGAAVAIRIIRGRKSHQLDYDFCKGIRSGCPVEPGAVEWWTGQHIIGLVSI